MQNTTAFYQAEVNYRQAQIRRDWQPIRSRRRARAEAREQVRRGDTGTN